jgi:spore photoproduct lyase
MLDIRRDDMTEEHFERFAAQQHWDCTILPKTKLPVYLAKRKGKWISKFTATPEDIFCPHFWVLGTSSGTCWFMCRECFLQGTYRAMRKPGVPLIYTNHDDMMRDVMEWLDDASLGRAVLTDGERGDSLLYDPDTGVSQLLVSEFGKQKQKKFMRLTKSTNVEHILELPHNAQTIVTFSVNAPEAQRVFESDRSPSIEARYEAALLAQKAGYEVRFRYDPAIPIEGWRDCYRRTLEHLADLGAAPSVITLGTPRRFKAVEVAIKYWGLESMNLPVALIEDGSDGRLRLPFDLRVEFLGSLVEMVKEVFPSVKIGICKETKRLRTALGFTDKDEACNCTVA